jgi:NDP-sugar pyrophosphorylase family protein
MKAIVLAAGEGSRMRPLTYTRPKVLVPVGGEPMLNHVVRGLGAMGVTEVLLVVQYLEEMVADWVQSVRIDGIRFGTIRQPATSYGTGAAALVGREWTADEPFVLHYGDILCAPVNYVRFAELARANPGHEILTVYGAGAVGGGAVFVEGAHATRIVEKPTPEQCAGAYVNAGIYLFQPDAYSILDRCGLSERGELELTDVPRVRMEQGVPPLACELTGFWSNVSDAAEVLRLNRLYGAGDPATGLVMGADCSVGEGASLRESMLLDGATVGGGVSARYAVVGEAAHVGSGCVLDGRADRPVVLADRVTVGAGCRLGGASLGPDVTLEDGCYVGEGAVLRNCLVRAGSSIDEGAVLEWAEIGAGSSIGPGYRLRGSEGNRVVIAGGSHWE